MRHSVIAATIPDLPPNRRARRAQESTLWREIRRAERRGGAVVKRDSKDAGK